MTAYPCPICGKPIKKLGTHMVTHAGQPIPERTTAMTHREYGRIDWMPRLRVWRVIAYNGRQDVDLSDHLTRAAAVDALQAYVKEVTR